MGMKQLLQNEARKSKNYEIVVVTLQAYKTNPVNRINGTFNDGVDYSQAE